MSGEAEADKAAGEPVGPADHATRLLLSEFFGNLHGLLENNAFYVLEDDTLFDWSAVEQF